MNEHAELLHAELRRVCVDGAAPREPGSPEMASIDRALQACDADQSLSELASVARSVFARIAAHLKSQPLSTTFKPASTASPRAGCAPAKE
jgi:hypothetical protein